MIVLHLKTGLIETPAVEDRTGLVEDQIGGTTILDLSAHLAVIHVSNAVRRATWQESVQMLQMIKDLPVRLGAVHASNVAKRVIKREIAQMQTYVVRVEIKESVEASIEMAIAEVTVEAVATIGEAIEEGTV